MPKTPIAAITVNPSLLAFKPRQLLLSNSNNNNNNKTMTMKPDQKALLVVSIAQYLESNGFSKTLKKFQSEAQIVKGDLSASSPDLEEIYCKYLETCNHASSDFNKHKAQDIETDGNSKKDGKKKKRTDDSDSHAINNQSGAANKLIDSKNAEEIITDDAVPEVNVKSKENKKSKDKKKKKSKLDSESLDDNVEHIESLPGATEEKSKDVPFLESKKVADSGTESKSKDKKKTKNKLTSDSLEEVECLKDTQEVNVTDVPLEDKSVKSKGKKKKKDGSENLSGREKKEDVANKENKGSKKRKRLASEENDSQPIDQNAVEESKRRKTEGSEDPRGNEQSTKVSASMGTDGHAGKESDGESNKAGQETYIKKLDALVNGNLEKSGEKSALQKTLKKQQNGSAEPKTVKPFQRVKVDEVAFTDERLQDNSYWAKDGAESGYGAKAQEVLGQVRGRDFRHEKTKKKRGTYRGGQIDLHSHSIKFNYSDDE